jgi:hypothetical protein
MKNTALRASVFTVAGLAALLAADAAQAQICSGFPAPQQGFYFGGRIDFPPSPLNSLGVEAAYNMAGPLSLFGGLNVLSIDDADGSTNEFRVGAAFELPAVGMAIGPRVSACPVVEARWISEDGTTFMEIPLGFGLGASLGAPVGPDIMGYVIPQLVIARISGGGFETETESNFGLRGGVMVGFGMFTVGGELQHLFITDADPVLGLRFGLRI